MTTHKTVIFEIGPDGIGLLTINRPEKLNALNQEVLSELKKIFEECNQTPWTKLKAILITGAGEKSFVAGADIAQMQTLTSTEALAFSLLGQQVFKLMERLNIPVIGAINGHVLGGGLELALACDILYAAPTGQWGLPEAKLGVIPGFGGWTRLKNAIGVQRAKMMVLTGKSFSAQEMKLFGLVTEVDSDVKTLARAEAKKIIQNGPLALKALKRLAETPAHELEEESKQFAALFNTQDQKEGMAAFLSKRTASFQQL